MDSINSGVDRRQSGMEESFAQGPAPLTPARSALAERVAKARVSHAEESLSPIRRSKRSGDALESPISQVIKVIDASSMEISPLKKDRKTLETGYQLLANASPDTKTKAGARLQLCFASCVERGSGVVTSSEGGMMAVPAIKQFERKSIFKFMGNVQDVLKKEHPALLNMLDIDHITTPVVFKGRARGFHWCPPGSLSANLIHGDLIINPMTAVWCASWTLEEVTKQSTFFPQSIDTLDRLLVLLSRSEQIITNAEETRALLKVPAFKQGKSHETQSEFFVEVYKKNSGTVLSSVFPVFYYTKYKSHGVIQLTHDLEVSAEEILELLRRNKFDISYSNESGVVVDIADLLKPRCSVAQGILIHFDRDCKDEILGLYDFHRGQ